jgi:hypothetical protein
MNRLDFFQMLYLWQTPQFVIPHDLPDPQPRFIIGFTTLDDIAAAPFHDETAYHS